ncbi:sodium/potassium-transporting ATPase subunit beta-2-like isoform X2 [Penaeus indicus]|uniref:sodium/potassium-transporting ATPase subunit beta-2-like isoform X2 n=1 Tax=Penaeus indicus TaxID=29960 RepID=UPI00300CCDB0
MPLNSFDIDSKVAEIKKNIMVLNLFYKVLIGVVVAVGVILVIALPIALFPCGDADRESPGLRAIPGGNILIKEGDPESRKPYVEKMTNFLKPYLEMSNKKEVVNCSSIARPKENEVCNFPKSSLTDCGQATNFSFSGSTPCVLLTLTMDQTFRPIPYESLNELPTNIPQDLHYEMRRNLENGKLRKVFVLFEFFFFFSFVSKLVFLNIRKYWKVHQLVDHFALH